MTLINKATNKLNFEVQCAPETMDGWLSEQSDPLSAQGMYDRVSVCGRDRMICCLTLTA
jgi:hypothetical protein